VIGEKEEAKRVAKLLESAYARQSQRFLVIGEKEEAKRVAKLLESAYARHEYVGLVSSSERLKKDKDFVGNINQVLDIFIISMR